MKVKVGNRIYDGENEPVMVILSKGDRENIANMFPDATKYCSYPSTEYWTKDDYKTIKAWMNDEVDYSVCSEVDIDKLREDLHIGWYEVTKEEIYNAMLVPGEYKEENGKFYVKMGMLDGYIDYSLLHEENMERLDELKDVKPGDKNEEIIPTMDND